MGPHRRGGRLRPEVLVVASTGLATFVAGAAGLLQNNLPVAVPALAVAAVATAYHYLGRLRGLERRPKTALDLYLKSKEMAERSRQDIISLQGVHKRTATDA